MPQVLEPNDPPIDKSTFVITVRFFDEDEVAMTPVTATWTLTKLNGTVINSRSAVSITPATSANIVLSGADLDYDDVAPGHPNRSAKY